MSKSIEDIVKKAEEDINKILSPLNDGFLDGNFYFIEDVTIKVEKSNSDCPPGWTRKDWKCKIKVEIL